MMEKITKMQIKQKSVSCLSHYIMTSTNALRNYSSTLEDYHPVQWSHMTTNWCTHTRLRWFPFMWLAMDQPMVLSELQSFTHYNHSLAMDTEIQQKSMKVSVRIHWPHETYDKEYCASRVPTVAQWDQRLLGSTGTQVPSGPAQWVKDPVLP